MDDLLRATADAEGHHFWFRGFRRFVRPLLKTATLGQPTVRILDCGCGTGTNLALLADYGDAYGFDLSDVGLAFARRAGRRHLLRARAGAVPFPAATFDLVTSFDVLYGLDDEEEPSAVAEMFRVLKPGGRLIINVAAMPILTGDHSILSHERRRYTRQTLRTLLARGGFDILRLTYTNATLVGPLMLIRGVHRLRGLAAEPDARREISIPPAPVNAALTGLLWLESLWVRVVGNPFGSSLLCLARKPE